jgi:hypothetical protein
MIGALKTCEVFVIPLLNISQISGFKNNHPVILQSIMKVLNAQWVSKVTEDIAMVDNIERHPSEGRIV